MKKSVVALSAMMLGISSVNAQDFSLTSSSDELIVVNHEINASLVGGALSVKTLIGSAEYVDYSKSYDIVSMNAGAPCLPFFTESVIVPGQGNLALEVSYDGYIDYENVLVAPSKGSLKRNVMPSSIPFTFGAEYSTDAFFPGDLATITDAFILRNTRGVTIVVNPYQYNPVTKVLRVYDNISAQVVIDAEEEGLNELTASVETSKTFIDVYDKLYLNAHMFASKYTPVEEEGTMLIISDDSYVDEMEPFIEWKNQSGVKTTIVTTDVAGTTDTEIKNYIEDYYDANPELLFVLLVGDHNKVPAHTYGTSGSEQLWSDSYYGQMTSDFYPELFVGRFSGTSIDITTMVDRTLEYEKDPASGNWMAKGIGLASNEGSGYGDDGEADWQHARNIRAKLLAYGYDEVFEFYDGSHGGADASGNPNAAMILPEINDGVGLFNYTGHGAEDVCVTGNFSSDDINDATNNGKYPFVVSVACNNGTFTSGSCISEVWMRATNAGSPSGAINACGSTILMAWAEPMQTQDEMAEIISESYVSNKKVTIGGLFYNAQISMLEDYGSSTTAKEVMQTWVMFGDPSTLFRNQETQEMVVTHVSTVGIGTSSVNVNCDVEGANIAISQDGNYLGEAIVSGGIATVSFPALSSTSPLMVVATKQNYRPYTGAIAVVNSAGLIDNNVNNVVVFPNPANESVNITWNSSSTPVQIELRDLSGKVVYNGVSIETNTTVDTRDYAAGIYLLNVTIDDNSTVTKLVIR